MNKHDFLLSDPSDYSEEEAMSIALDEKASDSPRQSLQAQFGATWFAISENRTDNELATRFIDNNAKKLRYAIEWGKWLVWDGRRWQVDIGETCVIRLARTFADRLWEGFTNVARQNTDRDELAQVRTFCKSANKDSGIRAFLNLARVDQRIAVRVDELNSKPNLLNLKNGTFDLDIGKLLPHSQTDLLTQIANVTFDQDAMAAKWHDAITTIFAGDVDLMRYVQQLLGYSISGDTGEHILPIAYGDGFNGKSMVWNTILRLLGDYAALANDTLLLGIQNSHPTEKMLLYQKRFVPISEPEQSEKLKESRVKELTGDGTITARHMHKDFGSFNRTHTFWLSTNHLPKINGNDDGIWRRVKLIPFTVDLRDVVTPILDLDKILVEDEGPGILNWLLEGYADYRMNGFVEPECVKQATGNYRTQEDELASFVLECCCIGPHYTVSAADLFGAYQKWNGTKSKTKFGKEMGDRFKKETPDAGEFRKKTMYLGIGLSHAEF